MLKKVSKLLVVGLGSVIDYQTFYILVSLGNFVHFLLRALINRYVDTY